MKHLLFCFLLTLCSWAIGTEPARADWVFVQYAPGWYLRTNGVTNDGYGYYKVCNYCGGCYCSYGCYYVNGGALPTANYSQVTVSYAKGWKERMVDALNTQKDNEMFLKSALALGLQVDQAYQSPSYMASGYTSNGLTTISQGFAAQGSTVYGLAAIPANPTIDVNTSLHEFQRGVDGVRDAMGQGYNLAASLNAQAIAGNVQAQETAEVARGYAQAILAQRTKVETQKWQTQTNPVLPAQPVRPQQPEAPPTQPTPPNQGQPPADPTPIEQPPPPNANNNSNANPNDVAIIRLKGGALFESMCLKCHGENGLKEAPNFASLASMNPGERTKLAHLAITRMTTESAGKPKMPKGAPALSDEQVQQIASYIAP